MKRLTSIPLVLCLVMLTAEKCDRNEVRKEMWKWKNKAGKALVATNDAWEKYYTIRADTLGDQVIKDNPGLPEDELVAKFEEAIADLDAHNARYQKAKVSTAEALEALEEALDAWQHIEDPDTGKRYKAIEAARDLLRGLDDLLTILIECGVKVPNILDTVVNGLGNFLDLLADEPDPDIE